MNRLLTCFAAGMIALAAPGCQFSPTAPFSGFDSQGSRVVGHFESGGGGATQSVASTSSSAGVEGIVVTSHERTSLRTTVNRNGAFTLTSVPSGSFTLVFQRDGRTIGEIRLVHVRRNQGIRLTVLLTQNDEVVLLAEQRDHVSFSGECPRGPGFWCQNQTGRNPNLSADEFRSFASEAASLLKAVPALDTPEEVAAAVCNTGNQFLRHLATLALNLAARTVRLDTPLIGEGAPYLRVGDAFQAAVAHLTGEKLLSGGEQEALKDVMDRINNAQNIDGCDQVREADDPDNDDPESTPPPEGPTPSGQMTICHIPPGNANARHTITIDASAWPAHQGHCAQGTCDYQGSCK